MPRKAQGWITFQSSEEERQILEQVCQQTQRTKTEILRELIRQMGQSADTTPLNINAIQFSDDEADEADDPEVLSENLERGSTQTSILPAVQISARNLLRATVKRIVKGNVNTEVTLEIAPGVELVSIVTRTSAEKLGLKKGKQVFAVIKSSSVMIAAG
jgi:molybdopterin-binding protein